MAKTRRKDAERLLDLLAKYRSDNDLIHEVMMKLPSEVASVLVDIDRDQTRALIATFISHASSQGWGFSYTDEIGNQCKRLLLELSDPQIRADLARCLLEVGVGHSRWHVMALFDEVLLSKHDTAEALAIADMLTDVPPHLRKWARTRATETKLHPVIWRALVAPNKGDDS